MKRFILALIILLSILLGCRSEPESIIQFDQPIKGRTINLSKKIGDSFFVHKNNDTIQYKLSYNKSTQFNYIIKPNNDTVFAGTITKRNELFLLNKHLLNGKFVIHALQFTDSTVTGIETEREQSTIIKNAIRYGDFSKVITDTTNGIKTLNVNKQQGIGLFRWVIDQLASEELVVDDYEYEVVELEDNISSPLPNKDSSLTQQKLINRVFPNPFIDNIHIELNTKAPYIFMIADMKGVIVNTTKLNTAQVIIQLPNLKSGQYILKVLNYENKSVDKIIIIKK